MPFSCAHIADLLYPYADHELSALERVTLEAHLDGCAACRQTLQRELAFLASIRARLAPPEAPESLRDGVDSSLDRADRTHRWRRRARQVAGPGVALAGLALALAGSGWLAATALGSRERGPGHDTPSGGPLVPAAACPSPDAPGGAADVPVDLIARYIEDPVDVPADDPELLARWMQAEVGVWTPPPRLGAVDAAPRRAWVTRLSGHRRAIGLEYRVAAARERAAPGAVESGAPRAYPVVVYAFDPRATRLVTERVRVVDGAQVRLRSARGVNLVFYDRGGVGYAVISPLSEDQLIGLIRDELAARDQAP